MSVPRGKGYDKITVGKRIKEFEKFPGTLPQFCRKNSLVLDHLATKAAQHFPEWWAENSQDLISQPCFYCRREFYPNSARQKFCSDKCSSDSRRDRDYFGGHRREGAGIAEGVCQVCLRPIKKRAQAHHVYGKANDPEGEHLVALHSGCHQTLEGLALMIASDDPQMWVRLMKLVWLKRHGAEDFDKELKVAMVWSDD